MLAQFPALDANWSAQLQLYQHTIVFCWAIWSPPDLASEPVLARVVPDYSARFGFFTADLDADELLPFFHETQVTTNPQLILLREGNFVDRVIGFATEEALRERFAQWSKRAGDSTLSGQVLTTLNLDDLAQALARFGIVSRLRESSHYAGGRYLRFGQGQADLTFERVEPTEYLVAGDALSPEEMSELAATVSSALRGLALQHRFEIYASFESSKLVAYFHYDWPLYSPPPP